MSLQQSALVKYCILVYPDHVYGIEYRTVLCQLRTCTLRCCPEPHESVGLCLVSGGLPPPSGGGIFFFSFLVPLQNRGLRRRRFRRGAQQVVVRANRWSSVGGTIRGPRTRLFVTHATHI